VLEPFRLVHPKEHCKIFILPAGGPGPNDRTQPQRGCPRSLAFGDRGDHESQPRRSRILRSRDYHRLCGSFSRRSPYLRFLRSGAAQIQHDHLIRFGTIGRSESRLFNALT